MTTTVVIPDAHVPFHSRRLWGRLLRFLEERRPNRVILLGDFVDFHAISQHRKVPHWRHSFAREVRAGREALAALREAAPSALMSYIPGNHEDRYSRFLEEHAEELSTLSAWPELLGLQELQVNPAPRGATVDTGGGQRVLVLHGHEDSPKGSAGAGNTVRKLLPRYGQNLHIGHMHRLALVCASLGGRSLFGVEGGHLVDPNAPVFTYAGRRPDWTPGWVLYDSAALSPLPTFHQ